MISFGYQNSTPIKKPFTLDFQKEVAEKRELYVTQNISFEPPANVRIDSLLYVLLNLNYLQRKDRPRVIFHLLLIEINCIVLI